MLRSVACVSLSAMLWLGSVCARQNIVPADTVTPGDAQNTQAMAFARQMGIGWNLGNTLEACGINGTSVRSYETAWGQPVTAKAVFDGIKAAGLRSVRIPVAWSNMIAADYTINPQLMNRVEEVAKYALDDELYVIINVHWDGGWIKTFPNKPDECMKKYKAIWTQISARFKGYSDHLIFESLNEEGSFDDLWNRWHGPQGQKKKAYDILNNINQEFTNLVRASGGNNTQRYLLIAGYATDIDRTTDPAFIMPQDPVSHSMISIHYYDPSTFTILQKDADWGKAAYTWGTPAEVAAVKADLMKMKRFADKGIPVVVGEFGCATKKDPASIARYTSTVCETAYSLGYVPMLWDTGGYYDRTICKFRDPLIGKAFARIAATPRP
jgi:endoglucanase